MIICCHTGCERLMISCLFYATLPLEEEWSSLSSYYMHYPYHPYPIQAALPVCSSCYQCRHLTDKFCSNTLTTPLLNFLQHILYYNSSYQRHTHVVTMMSLFLSITSCHIQICALFVIRWSSWCWISVLRPRVFKHQFQLLVSSQSIHHCSFYSILLSLYHHRLYPSYIYTGSRACHSTSLLPAEGVGRSPANHISPQCPITASITPVSIPSPHAWSHHISVYTSPQPRFYPPSNPFSKQTYSRSKYIK